jgi:hypothetical protein
MNRKLSIILGFLLLVGMSMTAEARTKERVKVAPLPLKALPSTAKLTVDTVFMDDFESDTIVWEVEDFFVQPYTYWHIDSYNAYGGSGNSWWCGTDSATGGWYNPGYASCWVQYLYSPVFDLTAVSSDTVLLNFMHYYSVEGPSGGEDWDCVNLWGSTDGGNNWFILYPDTTRGVSGYNLTQSSAWWYMGVAPFTTKVAGWGGRDQMWKPACFDLTPYKGDSLQLRFSVVSDGLEDDSSAGGGYGGAWYLDNISLDTLSAGGSSASIFYDDAESGNLGWTMGVKIPRLYWSRNTNRSYGGAYSLYNGDTTIYKQLDGQSDAIVSPYINLTTLNNTQPCIANFMAWVDMPKPSGGFIRDWDYFDIFVSDDSGATWDFINEYDSPATPQMSWNPIEVNLVLGAIDITDYTGKIIKLRIEMNTDADELSHGEGLYLDNFIVTGKGRDALPAPSTICLVDNDGNALDKEGNSWTKYMEASLANLGYRYSLVTIGSNKTMIPGYLEQYPLVIWNLGSNYDYISGPEYKALASSDQECIMSYLNNGGTLWMSGQNYFFANGTQLDTTVHPNILRDYLHLSADNGWASNTCYQAAGIAGDPIGDALADSLLYDRLNGEYPWTGPLKSYSLNPDTPTVDVKGFMQGDDGTLNGIYYEDSGLGYKIVYTSFPFEAVSLPDKRDTLASRIINWLRPGLNSDYTPPAVPTGLSASLSYDTVKCIWNQNTEADILGYSVYRSELAGMPTWTKVGTVLAPDTTFADTTVEPGLTYNYAIASFDTCLPKNESIKSAWVTIYVTPWKLGVEGEPTGLIPARFSLDQNSPNPCNGKTTLRYALPEPAKINLSIYNVAGQKVSTLIDREVKAGYHSVAWNGLDGSGNVVSKGVYFYRLVGMSQDGKSRYSETKRMIIVK